MAAPPWRPVSPSHGNNTHFNRKLNKNITQIHSHSHSPFHSKTTLLAYARNIHIALTKITDFRTPLSFNIEIHNCIPTIAYYVRYFNDQNPHTNADITSHESQPSQKNFRITK